MKTLTIALTVVLALITGAVAQQGCPIGTVGLAVGTSGPVLPGSAVGVSVTGAPGADAYIVLGPHIGATQGPGGAVLCISPVAGVASLGRIPASGTLTGAVPAAGSPGSVLHLQAFTIASTASNPSVDTSTVIGLPVAVPPCQHSNSIGLAAHPDMPVQPGDTLTFAVQAPPGSYVLLAHGPTLGHTPLVPGLALCLGQPFDVAIMGFVPPSGVIAALAFVPPNVVLPGNVNLFLQAVALVPTPAGIAIGTSNPDVLVF